MFLIPPTTPPLREWAQERAENSGSPSTLESLKSQLRAPSLEEEGFPSGVLIEWASSMRGQRGGGKIEALAPYLSSSGVWVHAGSGGDLSPPLGSKSDRSTHKTSELFLAPFFLERRLETWWGLKLPISRSADLGPVLLQILRSQSVQQIVLDSEWDAVWGADGSDQRVRWLRKLQIVARQSGVSVIFLKEVLSVSGVWPIAIQGLVDCSSKRVKWVKWYSKRDPSEVRVG